MTTDTDIGPCFDFHFDAGKNPVFRGGELVTGTLFIQLQKPMIVKLLKMQIKGRAVWRDDSPSKEGMEQVFFDKMSTVLERPQGDPEPGHFQWAGGFTWNLPFQFLMPTGCPSSYEGPHAYIRYFIRAILVREDEFGNLHNYYAKKVFTVVLPSEDHLVTGIPLRARDPASFGENCFKSRMTAELTIPKTGYLPGEPIYGDLKIGKNHPKDILNNMQIRLVDRVRRVGFQKISTLSPWRTLLVKKLEAHHKTPKNVKGAIEQNELFLLTVPPVCPSTMHVQDILRLCKKHHFTANPISFRCPFLRVQYAIHVTIGDDIILELPIHIGVLSTNDPANTLEASIGGAQLIEEADERDKHAINGPIMYTPMYPYPKSNKNDDDKMDNATDMETTPSVQSDCEHAEKTSVSSSDDYQSIIGNSSKESEHEMVYGVLETIYEADESEEATTIDDSSDTEMSSETSKSRIDEGVEVPEMNKVFESTEDFFELFEELIEESSSTATSDRRLQTINTVTNESEEETIENVHNEVVDSMNDTEHSAGSESDTVTTTHE